mgnify:CR=1 FL=1
MTQITTHHPRSGWKEDEARLLFDTVRAAAEDGRSLREVFQEVGGQLQRKPNSIRNYYYARVRETPDLSPRPTPFRAFTPEELHTLLREVLMGRGQGESVRACVTRLSGGDRSQMLRMQNKYRSVLKNRPELLMEAAEELRQEGLPAWRAFVYGSISGVVEPIFGILVVLVAAGVRPLMPWLLSFAAGAMLYVVVEELVPQAHSKAGTCGFVGGFLIMMILDVALG